MSMPVSRARALPLFALFLLPFRAPAAPSCIAAPLFRHLSFQCCSCLQPHFQGSGKLQVPAARQRLWRLSAEGSNPMKFRHGSRGVVTTAQSCKGKGRSSSNCIVEATQGLSSSPQQLLHCLLLLPRLPHQSHSPER